MPVTRLKHWIKPSLALFGIALLSIIALHSVCPEIDQYLLTAIKSCYATLGVWLENLPIKGLSLTLASFSAYALLWLVLFGISKCVKNDLQKAADAQALREGETYPAGTSNLSTLAEKLYPDGTVPALLGREAQLAELTRQCELAITQPYQLHIVAVWGEQGMGKTHLLHHFGSGLQKREISSLKGWRVFALQREIEYPKALVAGLGDSPCLLLWDDISLQDYNAKKCIDELKQACSARTKPTVLALTTWSEPKGGTVEERGGVNATIACNNLTLDVAKNIYPAAAQLPSPVQGHPLMLRILSEEGITPSFLASFSSSQEQLFEVCKRRGEHLAQRYVEVHGASPELQRALAIASSSDALPLTPEVVIALGLTSSDQTTLKQLGLCGAHQGLDMVNPIRPDLIGWAYALSVLGKENATPDQWQAFATLAWSYNFFNTGRFLDFAISQNNTMHPWVKALQAPQLNNSRAALNRAKAVFNAVIDYGTAGNFEAMQAQLAISDAIAAKFQDYPEIQLGRAKAAFNAVDYYGTAGNFEAMQAQLAISDAIAAKFPGNPEIQLVRAKAATNAVVDYGKAGKLIEVSQLGEKLYAYFQQSPEMWQIPPFNQEKFRDFTLQFKPH